jgi:hypothetical protein
MINHILYYIDIWLLVGTPTTILEIPRRVPFPYDEQSLEDGIAHASEGLHRMVGILGVAKRHGGEGVHQARLQVVRKEILCNSETGEQIVVAPDKIERVIPYEIR